MGKGFQIGSHTIGNGRDPFIIAEAGINHNGDLALAKKMIADAKKAGADAVKFQTFQTEEFIRNRDEMYTYRSQGKEVTESQYEMFKRTEFTKEEWQEIKKFCDMQEIIFLSTPVSVEDVNLLLELGIEAIKVGSDDFVNLPLLQDYAAFGLPMLLSSGMATEEEMRAAMEAAGGGKGHSVCLMLCTSEYPTPPQDVNAVKLLAMAEKFPEAILGLSDHTQGNIAAVLAVAYGACVFEKHFTLGHDLPGPDHWFSAEPEELKAWADAIRIACQMLGDRNLKPTETEWEMRAAAHRSVTAIKDIKAGEILSNDNLALLRPGNGIRPADFGKVLGKMAAHDIKDGMQLKWEDINQ